MRYEIPWFGHVLLWSTAAFAGAVVLCACREASAQRSRLEAQIALAQQAAAHAKDPASSRVVQWEADAGAKVTPRDRRKASASSRPKPVPGGGIVHYGWFGGGSDE